MHASLIAFLKGLEDVRHFLQARVRPANRVAVLANNKVGWKG
jgi:hypothetical protein